MTRIVRLTAEALAPLHYDRTLPLLRGIPLAEWPAVERKRLKSAQKRKRSSKPCSSAGWSLYHNRNMISSYGCALRWLEQNGLLDESVKPADRWPPGVLVRYIEWLEENYSHATVVHRLRYLERALAVLDPRANRQRFKNAIRHQGRPKSRAREDLVTTPELKILSAELRAKGRQVFDKYAVAGSDALRDGLMLGMIALLLQRPKEVLLLTWGQPDSHLYWSGHEWRIKLHAWETKDKEERDEPVPKELVEDLEFYLGEARPILYGEREVGTPLWISNRGRPLDYQVLYRMGRDRVFNRYGKHFSPHQGRKAGATFLAEDVSEDVEFASDLMGNSPAIRDAHYNAASVESAVRRVGSWIEKLKSKATVESLPDGP